jgi:hypothetical protein
VKKEEVRDFLTDLKQRQRFVTDKSEGFTFDRLGKAFAVTRQ